MLPQIKKILFTSDLTDTSRFAFSYAASLASRYCAKMIFLYVMEDVPHSAKGFLDLETLKKIRKSARDSAKDSLISKRQDMATIQSELSRFCESERPNLSDDSLGYMAYEVVVTEGNVIDEILITAEEYECDTIVLGSSRHGIFSQAQPGSVAKGVLKRSDRLMVIAPPLPRKS